MKPHRITSIIALAVCTAAFAVPPDVRDDGPSKVRPAVHHVARKDVDRDQELLRAYAARAAAEAAMCKQAARVCARKPQRDRQ